MPKDFDREAFQRELEAIPDGLVGDYVPHDWKAKREQPYHRVVAEMLAQGYTQKEIAIMVGRDPDTITRVARQPYVRERMINNIKSNAKQEIKAFLEKEVMPSLQMVVAVRNDPTAKTSDRLSAANTILDRFLGKAAQPIQHEIKEPSTMTDEELRNQIELELTQTGTSGPQPRSVDGEDISEFC